MSDGDRNLWTRILLTHSAPRTTCSSMSLIAIGTSRADGHTEPKPMSEFAWKKHEYVKKHGRRPEDTRYVVVFYSGGTLGMKYAPDQGNNPIAVSSRINNV